jgi:hypothetical protein
VAKGVQLDGGRELVLIQTQYPFLGSFLFKIVGAINRLSHNIGASPLGELPPPPPVNSTSVKGITANNVLTAPGEILHWVHTHNAPITRGIQYVTEISANDPNFLSPHPIDTGASRSGFVHLPANDDLGHPVTYYLRVTPQYHGSAPAKPTVFGGLQGPTQILMTGSTSMSLLPSQAAGTAVPGQGGKGIGPVVARGAVGGPKRRLT